MREGYKKTEVGVIPEDWEVVLLSDICEVNPKKDILENDDKVAFLPMEQVSNSGRIIKIHTRKYEEVSKGYTPFKNKDVLLAKITPCFENGKRALVENLQYKMGFGSTEFHVLRSLEERVMPKYLYYCIDTHRFKELAERNMTGSAGQKRVPTTFLKDFKLPIPPLKEQEKIAEILSTVDSQIDDTEKLIEKSKELKKGLMQKLLTKGIGHSEFKKTEVGEIPASWEVHLLTDICEINPRKDILENDEEVAFLAMDQVSNEGRIININTKKYKEVSKGYTPFKNNDVILAKITPCFENGKRALIENLQYKMGFGSTEFHVLRSFEGIVMSKYLYYCIDTYRFRELAERNMTGSAGQKRVPTIFLKDYKISIPPLKEQKQISEILSSVDSEIDEYENKKQKLENLKKGLMQQLLTGKIRVVK